MAAKAKKKAKPAAIEPPPCRVIRSVSSPILRLKFDVPRLVRFTDGDIGGLFAGKYQLPIIDLQTWARARAVLAAPRELVGILERSYPNREWVGRSFRVIKRRHVSESKAYSKRACYTVDEIEVTP